MRKITKYDLPIKRIGNEKNPKLIILLENPACDIDFIKRNPEYTMFKDGVYKDSGVMFGIEREYCKWWDDLLKITDLKLKDSEILALEYYPYGTSKDNKIKYQEIYGTKKKTAIWDGYAIRAQQENIKLLKKFMKQKVPVFVYYNAGWFDKVSELRSYTDNNNCSYKNQILRRLEIFISKL